MVTEFLVKDVYYSKSNHSFSCRATFDDNANGTVEIQVCSEKYYKSITDDPAFVLKETIDEDVPGKCTRQISTLYNFNFTQASNGTFLRCLATDHNVNMSATTECLPLVLKPPGKAIFILNLNSFIYQLSIYIKYKMIERDVRVSVSWQAGLSVTEAIGNLGVDIAESLNNIYIYIIFHHDFDDAIITI